MVFLYCIYHWSLKSLLMIFLYCWAHLIHNQQCFSLLNLFTGLKIICLPKFLINGSMHSLPMSSYPRIKHPLPTRSIVFKHWINKIAFLLVLTFPVIILFTYKYSITSKMRHWQFVIFLYLPCLIFFLSFMRSISCLLSRPSGINYIFCIRRSVTWPLPPFIMNFVLLFIWPGCKPLLANKYMLS